MFRVYVSLILSVMSVASIFANNVRISDNARFVGFLRNDSLQVRFPLAWDNSWRDGENWDAVYLFMKYRDPSRDGGAWHQAYLEEGGHNVGSTLAYTPMKSGENTVGLMVFRNENTNMGFGNISANIRLLWNFKHGTASYALNRDDFDNGKIEFAVFAIEMVYIPNGPYYLGDVISYNSILNEKSTDKRLISTEGETKISFEGKNNDIVTVPAVYPKGYNGFYCMKYEVSQKQYVTFLNFLTYSQQKERIGNNLDKLKPGQFVFGSTGEPTCRNSIIVTEKNGTSRPVVFGNNLNIADPYNRKDDGKAIACNFLTYADMLAYCQWAGLRPMTEMEYEKACRALFIHYDPANDFAWGNQNIRPLVSVSDEGMLTEAATGGANVNAGSFKGPVRCGAFADLYNTTQETAGASYWGVMEMSGNLKELCYNVRDGLSMLPNHGDGDMKASVAGWTATPSAFIVRGGGFTTTDSKELATSYRREDRTILQTEQRDSSIGFRAVHSVKPVDFVGEFIFLPNGGDREIKIACVGTPYTITGNQTLNGLYVWEQCDSTTVGQGAWQVIEGANAYNVSLTNLLNLSYIDKIVKFRRRTVRPVGDSYSNEVTVVVPGIPLLSSDYVIVSGCGGDVDPLIAEVNAVGTFSWYMVYENGDELIQQHSGFSRDTLILDPGMLKLPPDATGAYYPLRCEFSTGGTCFVANTTTVALDGIVTCPAEITDARDGNKYKIVQMPDCRCWFAEPLRYKTGASISVNNNDSNDNKYGRLYSWAVDLTSLDLCPDTWRVPGVMDLQDVAVAVNSRKASNYTVKWVPDFSDQGWYYDKSIFGRGFYTAGMDQNSYIQIFPDQLLFVDGWEQLSEFSPDVYLPVRCVKD